LRISVTDSTPVNETVHIMQTEPVQLRHRILSPLTHRRFLTMIQLGQPINRKKTIKCPSCGDRVLYVLHDRKAGDRLRYQDVRFLQASKTTVRNPLYCAKCDSQWINRSTGRLISCGKDDSRSLRQTVKATEMKASKASKSKASKVDYDFPPLTRKQVKESNDRQNKLNAKPQPKRKAVRE